MIINQSETNAVVQALCKRGLQGKAQKIFYASSLPEVDTDEVQRMIAGLKCNLDSFSRDIAEIEADYKGANDEKESCQG